MKIPIPQKQVNPTSKAMNENNSIDGEFMGKHATPVSAQKMLEPISHRQALPRKSLFQRVTGKIQHLRHFIRYHEALSKRIKTIEESKTKSQERLVFLNKNLEKIAKKFNGDEATKLFDFKSGCCFGLTSNYILFETRDEQERFDKILSTLSQDPEEGWVFWGRYYPNLADAIDTAQDKLRENPNTTDPDTQLLADLRPFCESLLLFQSPKNTTFSSSIPFQDANAAAQLVASESLEDDAVLQSTPHYAAGLKPEGVECLLSKMRTTVGEQQPERLFHISSGHHIIALKVSNQGYEVFDQNIPNYKKFFPISDENKLASFLTDRVQEMPVDTRLPFHDNNVFIITEFFLKPTLSTTQVENKKLKELLKEIPDTHRCSVNELNFCGYSQLHLAALEDNVEEIHRLLSNPGLKLNSCIGENGTLGSQDDRLTALHIACTKGNTEAARAMLKDERCSPSLLSAENKTPLWLASQGGYGVIVKDLLEVTPESINIPDVNGQSPLFIAAFLNHYDVVKVLTEHPDLTINQKRADGATALHTASYAGNTEIVELLLTNNDIEIDSRDENQETPLKMAAMRGHSECVAVLLDHGAHVDEDCIQATEAAGHYQIASKLREKLLPPTTPSSA